jgi:N-acetylneuraminic acid mutarotase
MVSGTMLAFLRPEASTKISERTLTFAQRVAYQRAIEEVYWRHRIWPKQRPDPKPSLDAVMSQAQLGNKVSGCLRDSLLLEGYWQKPITAEQLQAEIDRMARDTKQPQVLQELFEALGNDPAVIAECLARPVLTERLITDLSKQDQTRRIEPARTDGLRTMSAVTKLGRVAYTLPKIANADGPPCTDDTWTATTTTNAPEARSGQTAVWTGSEMIIWGGGAGLMFNTGGRYNPSTDSWTATSISNAPSVRIGHTAVWSGSEMIVWGGVDDTIHFFNTGGRYNPVTNSWTATNTTNAPDGRASHTAVWTGSEMIVWGGSNGIMPSVLNTGGRYNPISDNWVTTSTTNAPEARTSHTAVWTGSEMIVWGGADPNFLNTGGRYAPSTDSWLTTSTINAPDARQYHTAVLIGGEMVVWGGLASPTYFNTGGRYNPSTDGWVATSTVNAPSPRRDHTAVWTSSEMVVWGGTNDSTSFNTGGRYCAQSGPTPTPTPTPAARPKPTARARPTPAPRP